MRVSTVIPCFNYGHYLSQSVESVLAQSLRDLEVIIVDDGSNDDSREVARGLVAAHPDAPIRLVCQENSGSPGATRNAGIAQASGEYVLCLDADDRLHPEFLTACVAALDASPRAAIAYGNFQMFGDATDLIRPPDWNARQELDCNFIGTASLFRRGVWEQIGGYDPDPAMVGYEDWDFWVGCIEQGWQAVKAEGALWYYRVHGRGVYSQNVSRDQALKARIILRHPTLYSEGQQRWASGIVAGETTALRAVNTVGAMPPFVPARSRTAPSQRRSLPVRSVCLISKDYPPHVPGGIPRAVSMQARMLVSAGVEVHVITRSDTSTERMREDEGVIVHEVPEPGLGVPAGLNYLEIPLWSFVVAAKFAQLDASVRFDIVEAPDYRGEALHLTPRPQTALIVWLHTTMMPIWECEPSHVRTPGDDAWHALEMAALERADLLLAPSRLLLETTTRLLGGRMRPAELMPYLFDADAFPFRPREAREGPVRVLYYGRLEARKRPELAMHAVAAARDAGHPAELTLLGRDNGGHRGRVLEPLQRALRLDEVTYLGQASVETVRRVLARTDVAILPSQFDNSPLTVFEALSSGVPVITSDRVGTASWFTRDDGLLALPIDDPERFGKLAAAAMVDRGWMSSGPRAAALMRDMFSPAQVTERLLECYARVLAGRRETAGSDCAPARLSKSSRPPRPVAPPPSSIEGTRRNAVLAFADELVADSELLTAWADAFDARDDVTLVIHAPGWSESDAAAKLGPVVSSAGLDDDGAADLLALAVPASVGLEHRLASGSTAIYSRERRPAPFDGLPIVDHRSVKALREALCSSR